MHELNRRRWWQIFRRRRCVCGRLWACKLAGTPIDGAPVKDGAAQTAAILAAQNSTDAYIPRHGTARHIAVQGNASTWSELPTAAYPVVPHAPALLTAAWSGQTGVDRRRQAANRRPYPPRGPARPR